MNHPFRKYLVLAACLIGFSCAHHRDVRPGADGIHRVIVRSEDDEGSRDALSQANHYCEKVQKNRSAAIVSEDKKYVGSMNESDYKTAKTVSKVAQGVGTAGMIFGGRNEKTAGGVVGFGGAIADGAIGKGYTIEMKFKCQ